MELPQADPAPLLLRFAGFELDEANARLRRDGKAVALAPKALAVLCVLARKAGQLVGKESLLDAVWGHRHISESVLKTTISELRAALGDDARQPRFIETASRRGYRFIALTDAATTASLPSLPPAAGPGRLIGRAQGLNALRAAWQQALQGRRQMVWIAGEAGVGKTALIEEFLGELRTAVWAKGHCVEHFGTGEPYLPVLEALSDLCRRDPELILRLRSTAPSWLLQLPWFCTEADRSALRQELAGSPAERMVREARALFDAYSQDHPLVLVTEDLHWTDDATARMLDHFVRSQGSARILWIGSFRLTELVSTEQHPLNRIRHEMRLHKRCQEVVLESFSEREVADYIAAQFPLLDFSEPFVRTLHQHTDGLPLFLINVVDELVSQGVLDNSRRAAPAAETVLALPVPESLAGVIEKQMARLPAADREVLETASVCGQQFLAQTVAAVLDRKPSEVVGHCESMLRRGQWLKPLALAALPDGSLSAGYVFHHALYRRVFYQSLSEHRRAQAHRRVAAALMASRDPAAAAEGAGAAELASHYERGHDFMAAMRHYDAAAEHALRQGAPTEALLLSQRGLALGSGGVHSPARGELELALTLRAGVAGTHLYGISDARVVATYQQAQRLCDRTPESAAIGWVLTGIAQVTFGRGEFSTAAALAQRIDDLASRYQAPLLSLSACVVLGVSLSFQGNSAEACAVMRRGLALCEQLGSAVPQSGFLADPATHMGAQLALDLLLQGEVEASRASINAALARAQTLGHPSAIAIAAVFAGLIADRLGDVEGLSRHAETLRAIDAGHPGEAFEAHNLSLIQALLHFHQGAVEAALEQLRSWLALQTRRGSCFDNGRAFRLSAKALLSIGRLDEAAAETAAGLEWSARTGERLHYCGLMLTQAAIELARGSPGAARCSIETALVEARRQGVLWNELEALMALCQLPQATASDWAALDDCCTRFVQGRHTALVQEARALLSAKAAVAQGSEALPAASGFEASVSPAAGWLT